jgi:signal peptide peptidase SppA
MKLESPGGTAFGASELSDKIYNLAQEKRIVALADPYAFSAAYWIGSAATEFYSVPSGMVGSIGAFTIHFDMSEMLQKEGVKATIIKAGEKKAAGNPYEPLSDSAKEDLQKEVNNFYDSFVSGVARNRSVSNSLVLENFGQGGTVIANSGLQVGMIDGIMSSEGLLRREFQILQDEIESIQGKAFIARNELLLELE